MPIYSGPFTPLSTSGRVEYDAGSPCDVLVNLTPHALNVFELNGWGKEALTIPTHGVSRLETTVVAPRSYRDLGGLTMWVPDCLGFSNIETVSYGAVSGDLPPVADPSNGYYHAPVEPADPGCWPRKQGPRVFFLVSTLTAMALRESGRKDVLAPGPEIRDTGGRILGCRGLVRVR